MVRFNNNDILTGYIKQKLAAFNLPNYYNFRWTSDDDPTYFYNKRLLNGQHNFKIKNNIYDSYTHEYLGEYLRFHRDYTGVDLMSMYNCFSNTYCEKFALSKSLYPDLQYEIAVDDENDVYMLPVKLGKTYTVAIEGLNGYELFCSIYGKYQFNPGTDASDESVKNKSAITELTNATYYNVQSSLFSDPLIYKNLTTDFSEDTKNFIVSHEKDLKLFIKLPKSTKTSITVLEGDFSNATGKIFAPLHSMTLPENTTSANTELDLTAFKVKANSYIINTEYEEALEEFKPITSPQLLANNTGVSHPFADRLIEYLLEQVITPLDSIEDDFARVQKVLGEKMVAGKRVSFTMSNIWDKKMQALIYSEVYKLDNLGLLINGSSKKYQDTLGYVDKDAEMTIKSIDRKTKQVLTLSNVDIYPEVYKAAKRGEQ